ncbi:hypothetical protein HNQ93_002194 [Hymenobacter luteus]|uniref:Uncharacterized protein n=2 Tax=Hymenobacter TaxID=89966 RepID=A0A7W9WB13_9BACT|nr:MULTISPECIES: hypothetical protein [Hymenobacter]MBB4602237.1 hypothetical protein [Hymenobacter latericoloratus]MBB6059334.1 hypothetical protein [Hymenobacter luteus]
MRNYLLLRARLLVRLLRELGWWRLLLLGGLLGLATARALVVAAGSAKAAWLVPVVVAGLLWSLHRQRPDFLFLQLTAPGFRPWLAAEYALLSLPAAGVLVGCGRPGAALLTLVLAAGVALAPPATARAGRRHRQSMFRSVAFEWVGASRRRGAGLLWLGLLGAAAATRHTATGPALAVVGWLLVLLEVYGPVEPWAWLLPALTSPGRWLRGRVGWGLLYFGLTVAPLAAVLAQGPAGAGGTAALLLWCAVVLTMVVLAKYAFYPHATLARLTQAGAVVVGFSILGSNPAFGALLAACFLGLGLKSHRRLAYYQHA